MTRDEKSKRKERKSGGAIRKPNVNINNIQQKDDEQEYAQVLKILGGGYLDAIILTPEGPVTLNGKQMTVRCRIRGAIRKKSWITPGDLILISKREFNDSFCDVIHKYSLEEARKINNEGLVKISQDTEGAGESGSGNPADQDEVSDDAFDFDDI